MEKKRIEYFDATKGFAIFLMVFAHAIAWNFQDYKSICIFNPNQTQQELIGGFLWQLIYSFHMPLFFLISGYFTYFNISDKTNKTIYIQKIKNRTKRLLIPYIFTGFIILGIRGNYGFWFLLSLWQLSLVGYLFNYISYLFNKKNNIISDIVLAILFAIITKILFEKRLIYDFGNLGLFYEYVPAFIFGFLLRKYEILKNVFFSEKYISLYYFIFILLFCSRYLLIISDNNFIITNILRIRYYMLPILGSLLVIILFKTNKSTKIQSIFTTIGHNSFEIYVLHILFVIQIPQIGEHIINQNIVTCITLQIIYGTTISIIAIALSLLISKLLSKSKIISLLFFGK